MGGYIAASAALVDFVRSFASGFIFTTAIAAGHRAPVRWPRCKHLKTSTVERERQAQQNAAATC